MPSSRKTAAIAGLLAAWAGPVWALSPQEVLIVANEASGDSVALARTYAAYRNIHPRNIVLVRTTTQYGMSRAEYDSRILQPVRQALLDRKLKDKIRAVVLLWGVPVLAEGPPDAEANKAQAFVDRAAEKLHYRLAVDYELLGSVGRTFPAPRTPDLTPLGKLFNSPMPAPAEPLASASKLNEDILNLLSLKPKAVGELTDPAKRKVAVRQLLAMELELRGLAGLTAYLRDRPVADAPNLADLQQELGRAYLRLKQLQAGKPGPENVGEIVELITKTNGVLAASPYADQLASRIKMVSQVLRSDASADSELALLWWDDYPVRGAVPNPLYWKYRSSKTPPPVLMTARIDGPTSADALRIIKASLAAEKTGLRGVFYVDAGGPNRVDASARAQYDAKLANAYRFVRTKTKFRAVLDEKQALFAADSCPQAALYVGWYSLRKYVPAFQWVTGAVGWHVASWEAMHLRDPNSEEWCAKMIQNGVAATLGAVREPLLTNFPDPEEFFALLMTGKYTIAECYWRTIPTASWQFTLIADPLYNPFQADPQAELSDLPTGLAP